MTLTMSTEDFLEHYGVRGMKWGVRKKTDNTSSENSKKNSTLKKAAVIAGVGVVGVGVIYLASKNKTVRSLSSNTVNRGKSEANKILGSKKNTKLDPVVQAQRQAIQEHYKRGLQTNPEFTRMTPAKLMEQHNKSKSEFDRWLTLRERDLGYIYKGER